jgi:predicted nucleic acid-binding protein
VTPCAALSTSSAKTGSEIGLVYLDASALVKLVVYEPESAALHSWLGARAERVSSIVGAIELRRAVMRALASLHHGTGVEIPAKADALLGGLTLVDLDGGIALRAAALEPWSLRSLDAIHLATALSLDTLEAIVTYDARLAHAAATSSVPVASPGA